MSGSGADVPRRKKHVGSVPVIVRMANDSGEDITASQLRFPLAVPDAELRAFRGLPAFASVAGQMHDALRGLQLVCIKPEPIPKANQRLAPQRMQEYHAARLTLRHRVSLLIERLPPGARRLSCPFDDAGVRAYTGPRVGSKLLFFKVLVVKITKDKTSGASHREYSMRKLAFMPFQMPAEPTVYQVQKHTNDSEKRRAQHEHTHDLPLACDCLVARFWRTTIRCLNRT